jgi:hypothetical protein
MAQEFVIHPYEVYAQTVLIDRIIQKFAKHPLACKSAYREFLALYDERWKYVQQNLDLIRGMFYSSLKPYQTMPQILRTMKRITSDKIIDDEFYHFANFAASMKALCELMNEPQQQRVVDIYYLSCCISKILHEKDGSTFDMTKRYYDLLEALHEETARPEYFDFQALGQSAEGAPNKSNFTITIKDHLKSPITSTEDIKDILKDANEEPVTTPEELKDIFKDTHHDLMEEFDLDMKFLNEDNTLATNPFFAFHD